MAEATELQQAISALERAIVVLGKATKASLVQSDREQLLVNVRRAVQHMSAGSGYLAPAKVSEVTTFLRNPTSLLQLAGTAAYSPASSTIIGILKDMYDTFTADLEDRNTV